MRCDVGGAVEKVERRAAAREFDSGAQVEERGVGWREGQRAVEHGGGAGEIAHLLEDQAELMPPARVRRVGAAIFAGVGVGVEQVAGFARVKAGLDEIGHARSLKRKRRRT